MMMNVLMEYFLTLMPVILAHVCIFILLMFVITAKKQDLEDFRKKYALVCAYGVYGIIPVLIVPVFFVGG